MPLTATLLLAALAAAGLALIVATSALWKSDTRLLPLQLGLTLFSLILHTASLAALALETERAPLGGQYSGLSFTSWVLLSVFLIMQWRSAIPALGAFLLPMVAGLDLAALLVFHNEPPIPSSQRMHWLSVHASLSFLGLASFGLVCVFAVMYLIQERSLKRHRPGGIAGLLPSLERLDRLIYRALAIGFPLLTLGIFTGILWLASRTEGHPLPAAKTVFPVLAWVIYTAVLWARVMAGWRGRKLAWCSIAGFVLAMLTFLGIGV